MLSPKPILKTKLEFWKNVKMIWKLSTDKFFKFFGNNWQNTYWSIIIILISRLILKNGVMLANLKDPGKFDAEIE